MLGDWHVDDRNDPVKIIVLRVTDAGVSKVFAVDVFAKIVSPGLIRRLEGEVDIARHSEIIAPGIIRVEQRMVRDAIFMQPIKESHTDILLQP